jgi:two-component system, OmpR family, response regulator
MRLLIVEDERDLAEALRKAFREEGFACDLAMRGDEGLANARLWPYDLILVDLMLPGLAGGELVRRIRRTLATPILVLTARDTLADKVSLLDLGADDYLTKPFALQELLARARALLRRAAGDGRPTIGLGNVTIDPARRQVTRDGLPIELSPKEYALVHYLGLRPGRVISQAALYEHLHDEDDEAGSNVIEVYVSRIRKKLGPGFILTRRGEGYLIGG